MVGACRVYRFSFFLICFQACWGVWALGCRVYKACRVFRVDGFVGEVSESLQVNSRQNACNQKPSETQHRSGAHHFSLAPGFPEESARSKLQRCYPIKCV